MAHSGRIENETTVGDPGGPAWRGWRRNGLLFALALVLLAVSLLVREGPISGLQQKGVHAVLAALALILVAVWRRLGADWRRPLLVLLLALSVANVLRWSSERIGHIDLHDVTCYYLGGKYAPELGPFGLYPAAVRVDRLHHRYAKMRNVTYWAQSREGFEHQPLRHAAVEGRRLQKEVFSEERWAAFEHDVLYFQERMGKRRFRNFLRDKGFNATPGWLLYAHPLMNAVPVEHVPQLVLIDLVLLLGALGFAGFTFGLDAALFLALFLCVTISTKWLIPGSIILRYDWLSLLLVAMCLLRRSSHAVAGALTGFAGLFRIFPLLWAFGPGARFATQLIEAPRGKKWRAALPMFTFLAAFSLTVVTFEAVSVAYMGSDFALDQAAKIRHHTSTERLSSKRPGFAIALSYSGDFERHRMSSSQRERIEDFAPVRYVLALGLLGALGWALRRKSAVEAFALGYVPFFLLATGTYYYHVARATLVLLHACFLVNSRATSQVSPWARSERLRHQVGLGFFFLLEVHSNLMFYFFDDQEVFWTGWLSWALTAYCVGMTVWLFRENRMQDGDAAPDQKNPGSRPPSLTSEPGAHAPVGSPSGHKTPRALLP